MDVLLLEVAGSARKNDRLSEELKVIHSRISFLVLIWRRWLGQNGRRE